MANHAASKTKTPNLTHKQKIFVKAKIAGKTTVAAAMEAYPTVDYHSASVMGAQNLEKLSIKEALQKAYEFHGITIEAIVKPVADGLKADKVVITGKDEEAFAEVQPDHAIRLKAAGMAAMWIGVGKDSDTGSTNYNFVSITTDNKEKYGL